MSDTAKAKKQTYIDNGWPEAIDVHEGEHAVSEFAAPLVGALSPFGDLDFPQNRIPYVHPSTRVNR